VAAAEAQAAMALNYGRLVLNSAKFGTVRNNVVAYVHVTAPQRRFTPRGRERLT